jgi:hypothetical protein
MAQVHDRGAAAHLRVPGRLHSGRNVCAAVGAAGEFGSTADDEGDFRDGQRQGARPMLIDSAISAEVWRDVAGFEDIYEVSSHGRVRRRATGHILRPWIAAKRYHYVNLRGVNVKRKVGVHVLVAEAFHGPRPSPKHEVAHWDGSGTHNLAGNLRCATHLENVGDQKRHGTVHAPVFRGASHPRAKLGDQDVLHIRSVYSGRRGGLKDLADFYCVDSSTISRVARGIGWVGSVDSPG